MEWHNISRHGSSVHSLPVVNIKYFVLLDLPVVSLTLPTINLLARARPVKLMLSLFRWQPNQVFAVVFRTSHIFLAGAKVNWARLKVDQFLSVAKSSADVCSID